MEALRAGNRLALRAPPGAGKTTRVPAALLDAGLLRAGEEVVVLEPRRVAARMAARRVAAERGGAPGGEVGWQVRFESAVSSATRIRYVTEGVLLRRLLGDPELRGVGAVVLDEFHERSLDADLALALLREVQEALRPDLRLVVMSATLEAAPVAAWLGGCPVVGSEGRAWPVAVEHLGRRSSAPPGELVPAAVERLLDERADGSVLAFLPGAAEIRRALRALEPVAARRGVDVLPLHGDLRPEEQDRAILGGPRRRVVLATNVAEASVTVAGLFAVVDTGLHRVARYDAARGLDRLATERISRSSAEQRAGRAGRLGPGRCVRLYTEAEHLAMAEHAEPEVRRVDLAETALRLLAWGTRDLEGFGWLTPPEPAALDRALRLLADLGAASGAPPRLTATGRALLRHPVHPRHGRILVEAERRRCFPEAARVVAVLSERGVRLEGRAFGPAARAAASSAPSDAVMLAEQVEEARRRRFAPEALGALGLDERAARRAARVAAELAAGGARASDGGDEALLRATLAGHPDRVVRRREERSAEGVMVGGMGARLDASSVVHEGELFVALDAVDASDARGRHVRVRQASLVRREWLEELFPGAVRTADRAAFDESAERVVARRVTTFHDLVLDERETGSVDDGEAAVLLAEAALARPERAIERTRELDDLTARIGSLARWMPELGLPAPEALVGEAVRLLSVGRRSFAELRRAPVAETALGLLAPDLRRKLDALAPARLSLPSGRGARLEYRPGEAPVLASRLQDFFGLTRTPSVAGGRVPVVLHLLAPNRRPVQITQDLESFWRTIYPKVRTELSRRYPRHAWPENPLQ